MWRWEQQEPFGVNVPDDNPGGLGAFEFPLRFPGQYADKETNLAYNYFRDYDSSIGRYVESDPIGLLGVLRKSQLLFDEAKDGVLSPWLGADDLPLLRGTYNQRNLAMPAVSKFRVALNNYAYPPRPINMIDPTGEIGIGGGAIILGGLATAAGLLWYRACLENCSKYRNCPFPDDDENLANRKQWLDKCYQRCLTAATELFHSGTPGDLTPTTPKFP